MSTYFNSTNLKGKDLKKSTDKAKTQDQRILEWFRSRPLSMYTPFEVSFFVFNDSCPVTSIRRSMTNLTDKGLLEKTDVQKIGKWGKFNYTWRLA